MIYNRTIKLILEELEYKLAIQSNECKIYHKTTPHHSTKQLKVGTT